MIRNPPQKLGYQEGTIQATIKEGVEQGARNVDNVVKLANKVGDKVMGQVDNFGKQLANVTNKTVVSGAEHLSSGLKAVDSHLSDMTQNFRLNVNLEPQFVSGVTPTSSSQIDTLTSKLDDFVSLNKADMAASSADASKGVSLNGNAGPGYSAASDLADDVAKNASGVTGTVWDDIKGTQPPREGTTIPKSFEINANGEKLWVNPNGTKHMVEYSTRNISHGQKLTEQQLLRSFQGAVEQATSKKIEFNAKIIIDNWELIFSPAREVGQLPVIKHAVYLP